MLAALGAACGRSDKASREPVSRTPEVLEFELKDLSGKTVRLSDFRGKVVLLDFWATWCGPCEETVPWLGKLQERYGPRGFTVLGLSVDDYPEDVPLFVGEHGIRYPVLLDPDKKVFRRLGVPGVPATFLVDRDGRIVNEWLGFDAEIAADLENAVAELAERKAS